MTTGPLLCPVCGYGNRLGAQVCEDCGLMIPQYQACATCGFMNTADSRFCGSCGTAFQGVAPVPGHPEEPQVAAQAPAEVAEVTPVARRAAPPVAAGPAADLRPDAGLTAPARPRLVHVGTDVEIDIPVAPRDLIVGRPGGDPDIDVSGFPDASVVSRKHARLSLDGDRLVIEDLGSANGTFVNNVRIQGPTALADGDRVAFGQGAKVVFAVRHP